LRSIRSANIRVLHLGLSYAGLTRVSIQNDSAFEE
jgi:hypothetical protein